MIAYVDTSTLIKLLVEEPGSEAVGLIWDQADILAAERIMYVEARATLAGAHRDHRLTMRQHRDAISGLDELWAQLSVVEVTEAVIDKAVALAERHHLRGYDAVHLAAALLVGADVLTSSDRTLCLAARGEGLHVANPIG